MGLQYNMAVGQPKYSPQRDIAYLYPAIIEQCENRLYEGPFPALSRVLTDAGVTEDQLAECVRCYCELINAAHRRPGVPLEQCMEESGWFKQPDMARVALMFYIGSAMTGNMFSAIRDVTEINSRATGALTVESVEERAAKYANAGPLRRAYLRLRARWLTSRSSTFLPKGVERPAMH